MANITRKEEGGELHRRADERPFWDPFGMFRVLPGWVDPFGDLIPAKSVRTFTPAFDVRETPEAYVFEADLPGIKEEECEVSVSGKRLSVRGKRQSARRSENEKYSCSERTYGTFERTFTLSDNAQPEQGNVEFHDGVLLIEIPKRAEPEARRLLLSGAGGEDEGQEMAAGRAAQRARGGPPPARSRHRRRSAQGQPKRKR